MNSPQTSPSLPTGFSEPSRGELPLDWTGIAERIAGDFQPKTVLILGVRFSHLIDPLRRQAIIAEGIAAEAACLEGLPANIQEHYRCQPFSHPFERHYDLVLCLEDLEQASPEQAGPVVENICLHSDGCIFAPRMQASEGQVPRSSPSIEWWAAQFARFGFLFDGQAEVSYLDPEAMLFRAVSQPVDAVIAAYEGQLWSLAKENRARRDFEKEQRHELVLKEKESQQMLVQIAAERQAAGAKDQDILGLRHDLENRDGVIAAQAQTLSLLNQLVADKNQVIDDMVEEIAERNRVIADKDREIAEKVGIIAAKDAALTAQEQAFLEKDLLAQKRERLIDNLDQQNQQLRLQLIEKEDQLQGVLNSRSWRFMKIVQAVRTMIIPEGSRREQWLFSLFKGLSIWRHEGFGTFSRRLSQKLSGGRRKPTVYRPLKESTAAGFMAVEAVPVPPAVAPHTATVDIIVCIHNALSDVQRCLESVLRYTSPPYRLILVDDGSDSPTQEYLAAFSEEQQVPLIRNEKARGYTRAANQGFHFSDAEFAIVLNSDTVVTQSWLDRMLACAGSDPQIGIVGPLSNTASWQSVPDIFNQDGDWADNSLPEGITVVEMGQWVSQNSNRLYPRLPILNGFCLMLKRELINQIGFFDEESFGDGYGEENDYCLRAMKAGWKSAVAEDVYIYHAQSKSYSHERRKKLVERSDRALVSKHGQQMISDAVDVCRHDRVLLGTRARLQVMFDRQRTIRQGLQAFEGKRVLFILPITEPGGGGHVIVQEAEAMQKMGVDVRFLNLTSSQASFEDSFPGLSIPVLYVDSARKAAAVFDHFDALIATVYHSVNWMDSFLPGQPHPMRGYYIQDFEPDFFRSDTPEHRIAQRSYTRFPDLIRMTKTEWNRGIIREKIGVDCAVVGPSLDIDLFRPRPRRDPDWPKRPLRIAAMIRPSTPRRQPQLTMNVLKEFDRMHGRTIEIILFGSDPGDPEFQKLGVDFGWRHAGVLSRPRLASLMNEVDIFVDFSEFQAMGLTAMEAMACGVGVISPLKGGASSFIRDGENGLLVDSSSAKDCLAKLEKLSMDEALRSQLQQQAVQDICQYSPEKAAFNILRAVFGEGPGGAG